MMLSMFNYSNIETKGVKGIITVKPLYAELENLNNEGILKDKPFCICYCGKQKFQTDNTYGNSERPEWKNSFILNHGDEEHIKIRVCCMNLRTRVLEVIGEGLLHINVINKHIRPVSNKVYIYDKGVETGVVMVETSYLPRSEGKLSLQGYTPKENEVLKKTSLNILDDEATYENEYIHEYSSAKNSKVDLDTSIEDQKETDELDEFDRYFNKRW